MSTKAYVPPLRLVPAAGPPAGAVVVQPGQPLVLGRSSQSDVQLPDQVVSRRHAQLTRRNDEWLITDLDSRHGTFVNGVRLTPGEPTPVQQDDRVRIGPWTFRVRTDELSPATSFSLGPDAGAGATRVQRIGDRELALSAEARLDALIEAAARIAAAEGEREIAAAALDAVLGVTGFPRGAILRTSATQDSVDVIAFRAESPVAPAGIGGMPTLTAPPTGVPATAPAPEMFSRSLIAAAAQGSVVRLEDAGALGHSIMSLDIQRALCAPIMVDGVADAYIYLDARGDEAARRVRNDAAAFCSAIAKICSLSLGNLHRHRLAARQKHLEADLRAARRAQLMICPEPTGAHGPLRWAARARPGRFVAGDLMDAVPLPDGRLAAILGDVSGKGAGTGLLMVTAQTRLAALLRSGAPLGEAVGEVNRFLARCADRTVRELQETGLFVSLACAIISHDSAQLIDAGHGYIAMWHRGLASRVRCEGGPPLGVIADADYAVESIPFTPGSRLVLFSDGVVEQPGKGENADQFGFDRTLAALTASARAEDDVDTLFHALTEHAGADAFADDVSILSVANA